MVMPDAAELVWGVLSLLILLALAAVVVSVVLLATRKRKGRDEVLARIDARLARLEQREDSGTDA